MKEKQYIQISKSSLVILVVIANLFTLLVTIIALENVPKLMKLFNDMLDGEPLPMLTVWLIISYKYLWVLPAFLISLALAFYKSESASVLYSGALAFLSTIAFFGMQLFIVWATSAPLLYLIDKLSG